MARAVKERKVYTFVYHRAVAGDGTIGAHVMKDQQGRAAKLPAGAKVVGAYTHGIIAPTSGGAAGINVGVTGDPDAFLHGALTPGDGDSTLAADAYSDASYAVPFKVGASAVDVICTIDTATLTAGKFELDVEVIV